MDDDDLPDGERFSPSLLEVYAQKLSNDWLKSKNKQYLSEMTSKLPKQSGEKLVFSPQGPEAYAMPSFNVFAYDWPSPEPQVWAKCRS